jgi:hypothetical protein
MQSQCQESAHSINGNERTEKKACIDEFPAGDGTIKDFQCPTQETVKGKKRYIMKKAYVIYHRPPAGFPWQNSKTLAVSTLESIFHHRLSFLSQLRRFAKHIRPQSPPRFGLELLSFLFYFIGQERFVFRCKEGDDAVVIAFNTSDPEANCGKRLPGVIRKKAGNDAIPERPMRCVCG